jgi:hypothetical protein
MGLLLQLLASRRNSMTLNAFLSWLRHGIERQACRLMQLTRAWSINAGAAAAAGAHAFIGADA